MADYSAEDLSPRGQGNKSQEMAVRRAYDLNAALIELLRQEGTVAKVIDLHRSLMWENKTLRDLFATRRSPEFRYKDVWAWTVNHWYDGGLKRSVDVTMNNIHSTNRKAIKGKISELYG